MINKPPWKDDAVYTIMVRDDEWPVYIGTHRLHYECKDHAGEHVITWSDHNTQEEIPRLPACEGILCGKPKIVIGGCHTLHAHDKEPAGPAIVYPHVEIRFPVNAQDS